ncbi:hypothetical protein [Olsenella sp. An188]|nr:hypothetical protein [Olsenella sp. An188]
MKRFQKAVAAVIVASLTLLVLLTVALLCSMLLSGIVGTLRGIAW